MYFITHSYRKYTVKRIEPVAVYSFLSIANWKTFNDIELILVGNAIIGDLATLLDSCNSIIT